MANWREKVDPSIKDHLEIQIAEASKHREAYKMANDPSIAQLWCSLANLSKQITELGMRLKYLESAVKQALPKARIETMEDRELMKRMIGIEKLLSKEKSRPTRKGKSLKKTLKKY